MNVRGQHPTFELLDLADSDERMPSAADRLGGRRRARRDHRSLPAQAARRALWLGAGAPGRARGARAARRASRRGAPARRRGPPVRRALGVPGADAERYLGRHHEVAAQTGRLRNQPLLVVAGPSGAGKSSPGLAGARLRAWCRRDPGCRLLVFVDRFEELYTLGADPAERAAFVACLEGAADDASSSLRVVLAIRSDFLYRMAEEDHFIAEAVRGLFFLRPMGRPGLRCSARTAPGSSPRPRTGPCGSGMPTAAAPRWCSATTTAGATPPPGARTADRSSRRRSTGPRGCFASTSTPRRS